MPERKRPTLGAPRTEGRPEVELFERVFVTQPGTKPRVKELDPILERINRATTTDDALAAICDGLDVVLAPVNGQRTTAGKLVRDNWDAGNLELADLSAFFEDVQELVSARPT